MWASLSVGVVVLGLKWLAWRLTGSVGLYSDALESIVNVVAALVGLVFVSVAARPADAGHPFGHAKAEYFAAGLEGALVLVAAWSLLRAAWERWASPAPVVDLWRGGAVSGLATALNGALGVYLVRRGRALRSPTLRADGAHVLTDVATSAGVLLGVGAARATGVLALDPLVAAFVAVNIVWSGGRLVVDAVGGLMDEALPEAELTAVERAARSACDSGYTADVLRTRRAGHATFVEVRLVVPPETSVRASHDCCDRIEAAIAEVAEGATTTVHVEPAEE
ncbi:MAG: cation transporter [Polyangiaceae bacterium]|nr:cation transporter [Polyangiaceae bacterium]